MIFGICVACVCKKSFIASKIGNRLLQQEQKNQLCENFDSVDIKEDLVKGDHKSSFLCNTKILTSSYIFQNRLSLQIGSL